MVRCAPEPAGQEPGHRTAGDLIDPLTALSVYLTAMDRIAEDTQPDLKRLRDAITEAKRQCARLAQIMDEITGPNSHARTGIDLTTPAGDAARPIK